MAFSHVTSFTCNYSQSERKAKITSVSLICILKCENKNKCFEKWHITNERASEWMDLISFTSKQGERESKSYLPSHSSA